MAKLGLVAAQGEIGELTCTFCPISYIWLADNVLTVNPSNNIFDYQELAAEETEIGINVDEEDDNEEEDRDGDDKEDEDKDDENKSSGSSSSEDEDVSDHDIGNRLEPYRPLVSYDDEHGEHGDQDHDSTVMAANIVYNVSCQLHKPPTAQQFPGVAGKIYRTEDTNNKVYGEVVGTSENLYAPFSSQLEWEMAKWAKLQGPSSTAFSDMMKIEGVSKY
jgi:hypothetical protein